MDKEYEDKPKKFIMFNININYPYDGLPMKEVYVKRIISIRIYYFLPIL